MTITELAQVLVDTGLPVAYRAFDAEKAPDMPFIVYQETGTNNFGADNIVWVPVSRIQIDLLTRFRDRTSESQVETALTSAGLFWQRESDYEDTEDYYRTTYQVEI